MLAWIVRAYKAASHGKDVYEWLVILGAAGVPGITAGVAFFTRQPWDLVLLYLLAGIAFWIVVVVEGLPALRARLTVRRDDLCRTLEADAQELHKRVNEWEAASLANDRRTAEKKRDEATFVKTRIDARLFLEVSEPVAGYFRRSKPHEPYSRKRLENLPDGNHINEMAWRVVRLEEIVRDIKSGKIPLAS